MPFSCINITDVSQTCSRLLKYCNDNYALEVNWCNCIIDNHNKCDGFNLLYLLIPITPMVILIVAFCYYPYKNRKQSNTQNNISGEPINHYPEALIPISTNIRNNAITNLQPMIITPTDTNISSELPKYENPPEYNSFSVITSKTESLA